MKNYCLDDDNFVALAKAQSNKSIYQRLMMLAYLKESMSKAQVSRLTFTAPDRVYAWLKRFHEPGIEGLKDKPSSGRPRLLDQPMVPLSKKQRTRRVLCQGVVFEEKLLFS